MVRPHLQLLLLAWLFMAPAAAGGSQDRRAVAEADRAYHLAIKLEQSGNREQALTIFYRLVDDFPGNQRYYQQLKRLLRNTNQQTELLKVIDEYLVRRPVDIQSRVEIGDAYLALGQKEQALAAWEGILQLFPGNLMAERLVLTHLIANNFTEEATAKLEQLRAVKHDSSFFALDMGRLYASRLNFDLATDEYLRYLASQPQTAGMITNQLLRFPVEPEVMDMLRKKLLSRGSPAALRALASVEFKHRNFTHVMELYRLAQAPPKDLLDLALDLIDEGEYDLAQQLMQQILSDPAAEFLYEQAIMELAGIYLARTQRLQATLSLAGFYPRNRFFDLPFISIAESQLGPLRRSIALYDSLITTWQSPWARSRLGNIKYRILDDFDGAITDLQAALQDRRARSMHPEIMLRLVDIWIAKGDLDAAERVRQESERRLNSKDQLSLVELKGVEILFLAGHRDSLLATLGGMLAALGPDDPYFNDLMELSGLVRRFQGWPEPYQAFIQSERLVRQNRRSEAVALLSATLEQGLTPVSPILQYRLAHLHALQGNYFQAENVSLSIAGDTEFNEMGLLLAAEIADYLVGDKNAAATRYLAFLDTYPLSIYHDPVRLRYRVLRPEFN